MILVEGVGLTGLTRFAVEICSNDKFKKVVLVDHSKAVYWRIDRGAKCSKLVATKRKKATVGTPDLLSDFYDKLVCVTQCIANRMESWAAYHKRVLRVWRVYSFSFLNSSFFTLQGIIDSKLAAIELMKDINLNVKQRYTLACIYCFEADIRALFRQMTEKEKEEFYDALSPKRIIKPQLVKFWSYYLMDDIDRLRGEKGVNQYMLEKAVESGSKAAVEYCLEKSNFGLNGADIVNAAIQTIMIRLRRENMLLRGAHSESDGHGEPSPPIEFYMDIMCFLISKMRIDQQIEFFKKDIDATCYGYGGDDPAYFFKHSRVLEYFLDWPYQDYFMKTANVMWDFLPEKSYDDLLLTICQHMSSSVLESFAIQENSYDYKKLLRDFWSSSPQHCKRYVYRDREFSLRYVSERKLPAYVTSHVSKRKFLAYYVTIDNFTEEDRNNAILILASASTEVKDNIISSEEGTKICTGLVETERWEMLDEFIRNFIPCEEKENEFRGQLCFKKEVKRIIGGFVMKGNVNAAEHIIKGSALNEEAINELKRQIIYSVSGIKTCVHLLSSNKSLEAVCRFVGWFFRLEEDIKAFKKYLVFNSATIDECVRLIRRNGLGLVDEFVKWGLSSEEDIRELRKSIGLTRGASVCDYYLCHKEVERLSKKTSTVKDIPTDEVLKSEGGEWVRVEEFLTWCFSSESEINNFKRETLLKKSKRYFDNIHLNLIKAHQWEKADTFFSWIGLSAQEIKELKKETMFDSSSYVYNMFTQIVYYGCGVFSDYGNKQEVIELFLRWYLTDKENLLKFKNKFTDRNKAIRDIELNETMLPPLYLAIDQLLND